MTAPAEAAAPPEGFALDGKMSPSEAAVVAALAAYLAAQATATAAAPATLTAQAGWASARALATTTGIAGRLLVALLKLGLDRRALRAVVTMTITITVRGGRDDRDARGVAARRTAEREHLFRAAYIIAATRRVTEALRSPALRRQGQPVPGAFQRLRDALSWERRYLRQHLEATRNRARAAAAADRAARGGRQLRWVAIDDTVTTPDCRALNGIVFDVGNPPGGRWPGAVHPRCRCYAVPA